MSKIIITSDSTSDLSPELRERYNIKIIPLGITLGGKSYLDAVDISPDDIYEHQERTGELPKTTASNIDQYIAFFGELTEAGYTVIHFSLSSSMSSTFNNSRIVAEEFENVYVIDSQNLSTGIGLLMIAAAEMALKGKDAEAIVEEINGLIPCVDASFVLNDLEYLHKGGRCSSVAVLGANLLKLKPCIEVKNGAMGVGKKYRGKYSDVILNNYIPERLGDGSDVITDRIFVTHSGVDAEFMEEVVKKVKETVHFDEVFLTRAGCTISSHCGPNTLGILFIRKKPLE